MLNEAKDKGGDSNLNALKKKKKTQSQKPLAPLVIEIFRIFSNK